MINNKQVNLWRGTDTPPTIYHIWIYNNSEMRLYNGTEWVTFIDEIFILERLQLLEDKVTTNIENIDKIINFTINNKKISTNPTISSKDVPSSFTGLVGGNNVEEKLICANNLLTTLIIE